MHFRLTPLLIGLVLAACDKESTDPEGGIPAPPLPGPEAVAPEDRVFSESSRCMACHAEAHASWRDSHHALAHRDSGAPTDDKAFAGRSVTNGDASWNFSGGAGHPTIRWSDPAAETIDQPAPMAIGLEPLVQYILETEPGRYQVPDMAWDPVEEEWYSIYGNENRRPNEWGHWTNRGMNWNSQCAWCHFTHFEKNYNPESDHYDSAWTEQGVGCAQCHGPNRTDHVGDECLIDPKASYSKEQWLHTCATCHARRGEFDESFTLGDSFHDHYQTALPDQPGLWHPDGQQLDEVYNFNSLMLSRMGHQGITCNDCHDPHASMPRGGDLAVRSNALCLTCHSAGANNAIVINPATHMFHEAGTPGGSCVDCHMPKKTYMGRDDRSDHRFPRPDPLLTKELGTPNACNTCHEDKGLDWQIKSAHQWYGEDMNAASRLRTRAIHSAHQNQAGALPKLIEAYDKEEIDAWQATLLRLMEPWLPDSRVVERTNLAAQQGGPLVRAAAARLVARRGDTGPILEKLLADPLKAVRSEAAWTAYERLPADHPAVLEVEQISRHQSDQPGGALRMARIAIARGKAADAEKWLKRAAAWDATSPLPRMELAAFLSGLGRTGESVTWLEEAMPLHPDNAEIRYLAALAHAELGNYEKAENYFRLTLEIQPAFARAWYNLGLLQSSQDKSGEAIASLRRASAADTSSPDADYARATIHAKLGQRQDAVQAANEALRRNPNHAPSLQLLRQLGDR